MSVELISYPPRPLNAGPLELAAKKFGKHLYSPKLNGYRCLVHTPTGTIFNRTGGLLAIRSEFAEVLKRLQLSRFTWLDCEALERRHGIGKGSLMVIDSPIRGNAQERFDALSTEFAVHKYEQAPDENSLFLIPQMVLEPAAALDLWKELQGLNAEWACDFFEGIVTKRADSLYPIQTRDPERTFPAWTKSRWRW